MSDFANAPNVEKDFEQQRGESLPGPMKDVNETARAELDNRYNHDRAHDAHYRAWKDEMRKLSRTSDPYPDFDLGSRAHRNLVNDYDEALALSRMKAVQIDQRFETRRDIIRNSGNTLSHAFENTARAIEEARNLRASPYVAHAHEKARGMKR
ncbi:MAG: hypothetical protein AAF250_10820 [Pseudomonadota bacterium]